MLDPTAKLVDELRRRVGSAVYGRVSGSEGAAVRTRLAQATNRRFADGAPIARVHADASMFIGGLAALLLQSMHPLAMAGVADHSDYRVDPWGRLARTSRFLALTTFGSDADAEREIEVVRAIHRRVVGVAPDGRPYSASDPHLIRWVHVAEITAFLGAHQRYATVPLTPDEADTYVAQAAATALGLGAVTVPENVAELNGAMEEFRAELAGSAAARAAARYLVYQPPLPLAARPAYLVVAAAAVGILPRWSRWPLRLPWLPVAEATTVRLAGRAVTELFRWAMPARPAAARPAI